MLPDYQLIEAIKHGSECEFKEALARGARADARDLDGASALLLAAKRGELDMVRILLDRGADASMKIDAKGNTPLHYASATGNFGFAVQLLHHLKDFDQKNILEQTPLHVAVAAGHEYLACELIKCGAWPDSIDRHGNTPMHLAARNGNDALLKRLHDVGSSLSMRNRNGYTPLLEAAKQGRLSSMRLLLNWGSPVVGPTPEVPASTVVTQWGKPELAEILRAAEQHDTTYHRDFCDVNRPYSMMR